jgi:hypothetical protein
MGADQQLLSQAARMNESFLGRLLSRFRCINGSKTNPQLMHRCTTDSGASSGRCSSIINPLHF